MYNEDSMAMTVTDGSLNTSTNTIIYPQLDWQWNWPPYNGYIYVYPPYVYPTYPAFCSSECHVFECEHATKCKCGKASRKVEPPKCHACGKKRD